MRYLTVAPHVPLRVKFSRLQFYQDSVARPAGAAMESKLKSRLGNCNPSLRPPAGAGHRRSSR